MAKVGFGGGCHWCRPRVFSHRRCAASRRSTRVSATIDGAFHLADTAGRGVIVTFDPTVIGFDDVCCPKGPSSERTPPPEPVRASKAKPPRFGPQTILHI